MVTLQAVIDENVYINDSNIKKETTMKIQMTALISLGDFEKLMKLADNDRIVVLQTK